MIEKYTSVHSFAGGGLGTSKEVDAQERTLLFWQEIYDQGGAIVETHEKYPVDRGHRKER